MSPLWATVPLVADVQIAVSAQRCLQQEPLRSVLDWSMAANGVASAEDGLRLVEFVESRVNMSGHACFALYDRTLAANINNVVFMSMDCQPRRLSVTYTEHIQGIDQETVATGTILGNTSPRL